MRGSYIFENKYWFFFGYAVDWPVNKCDECYDLLNKSHKPNPHCINCWKLEIFFSNCNDVEGVKKYFLEEGRKDPTLHGKWLKKEVEIPRPLLTSIPVEAHPDPEVAKDGAVLIYCQTIKEREERRRKILADLRALNLYKKGDISYRRGCVNFDEVIGNWKTWHPLDRDYEEK